jgi:Chaperone of endosialidase
MKKMYAKIIALWAIITLSILSTGIVQNTHAGYFSMWGNTYECPDPTSEWYAVQDNQCYSTCFVQDTKVTMADGTTKNIQDVLIWDVLKGSKGNNTVINLIRKNHKGLIYSFNGGKHFVTDSHPFMTTDGWKSINPTETAKIDPGLEVTQLKIWDILITEKWKIILESLDGKELPQKVYTFTVDGTHDYYADEYLVHNKYSAEFWCPSGRRWSQAWEWVYDWSYHTLSYTSSSCHLRLLWNPTLIWSGWGAIAIDTDIYNMIYWDKNSNGIYDNGTDRSIVAPSYWVSSSWDTWYPYVLAFPFYLSGVNFWFNNGISILAAWTYNYGLSQSSTAWTNLMNQWFTTNDPTNGVKIIGTWFSIITWLQVWLDYSCAGTWTQTVSFIEYSCPSGYAPSGNGCYTWSVVTWGPCTSNNDCTTPWTCNGYSYTPPNSVFKYNDAGPWNASNSHWNDRPHGAVWYCRNGDPAYWCLPNDPNQSPNRYGGGVLCGCSNFIPNNDSSTTYGACTTSSSQYIPAIENTVIDTVQCTWTGWGWWGSCVSSRTCPFLYTLTWDTNWNGSPNCIGVIPYAEVTFSWYTSPPGCDGAVNDLQDVYVNFYRNIAKTKLFNTTNLQVNRAVRAIPNGARENYSTTVSWTWALLWSQNVNDHICGCTNGACLQNYSDAVITSMQYQWNVEAIDGNACCTITTEIPTVCDLNDPLMAWVCYIPSWFGTTLLVTNGMVGINTLSPAYPLDVEWVIRAAQVLTLSDARLKSSIEKIDWALEKIRAINGYSFTWKKDGTPDLWVLAQEIEKVFANAVSTDTNGKKTVQYSALLAPIIEAIKELHTHIDTLSNEKFDAQVKRIEAIEEKMK